MTTEVEIHQDKDRTTVAQYVPVNTGAARIREAAEVMALCKQLADAVCNTNMMPKHLRGKPEETAAVMLYGATLDMDPMQAVRSIYEVHGQPGLYGKAMVGLVIGRGHEVWTVETGDDSVTVAGRRRGSPNVEQSTWTMQRAVTAGYVPTIDPDTGKYRLNKWGKVDGNEKYLTDPQAMLYAKAASEVCRKVAPDVLAGVYAVEDLQSERFDNQPTAHTVTVERDTSGADRMRQVLGKETTPEPATETPDVTPADSGSVTPAQLKKIGASMSDIGLKDRKVALEYVADIIERTVTTRNDLTQREASALIEALQRDINDRDADQSTGEIHDAEVVDQPLADPTDGTPDPWGQP